MIADWGISARNRKVRTYKLTPAGRKQLARETKDWERMRSTIDRFLGSIPDALAPASIE